MHRRQKYRSLKERMATLLFSPRRPADKAEDKHGPLSQHSADSALGSSRPDSNSGRRESKVNLAGSSCKLRKLSQSFSCSAKPWLLFDCGEHARCLEHTYTHSHSAWGQTLRAGHADKR